MKEVDSKYRVSANVKKRRVVGAELQLLFLVMVLVTIFSKDATG